MRRRKFIAGFSAAAWPVVARAQRPERMRRVAVLDSPVGHKRPPALQKKIAGWRLVTEVERPLRERRQSV